MEAQQPLGTDDVELARRLTARDLNVVADIEGAYKRPLRSLLNRYKGRYIKDQDVEEILQDVMHAVWTSYREAEGVPVRVFLFNVAHKRLIDRLRRTSRSTRGLEAAQPVLAVPIESTEMGPRESCECQERDDRHVRLKRMIDEVAVPKLTARQRRAFLRRFAAGDGEAWAKRLEEETGVPAKQWRKASDDALAKIKKILESNGVKYLLEEGRYDIEKARETA